MSPPPGIWQDKTKIMLLKVYWEAGMNATEIARQLGPRFNKNKVIGKAHRLGIAQGASRPWLDATVVIRMRDWTMAARQNRLRKETDFSSKCVTKDCNSTAQPGNKYRLCAECNHRRILEGEKRENVGKELSVGAPIRRTA